MKTGVSYLVKNEWFLERFLELSGVLFWIVPFRLSLWPDGLDVWRDLRSLGQDRWMRLLLHWCDRRLEW